MHPLRRLLGSAVAILAVAVPLAMAQTAPVPPPAPRTPTPPQGQLVEGPVSKVDPLAQTVQVGSVLGPRSLTVAVTPDPAIASADGRQTSLLDIREGDRVKASYEDRDGRNIAKALEVTPAEAMGPSGTGGRESEFAPIQ